MINAVDIDCITITEVINCKDCKEPFTEDIIIEFPEHMKQEPISFKEVGLVNARGELRGYDDNPYPITSIDFYGKLKRKHIK